MRVDTLVTDKRGIPILDLEQTDFEVFEDGKPQTVESFRLIRANGAEPAETTRAIRSRADEAQAAANEDARIFVFFLDDYHVRLRNSLSVRKALVEFIQANVGPGDLLAVMYPLTPIDAVTLTRDHQSVIRALARFEGRKFNYQPRHAVEAQYAHYPPESIERVRRQVSLTALESLAVKLGVIREERKAVIVVSEGYTALLPPALRDPVAGVGEIGESRAGATPRLDGVMTRRPAPKSVPSSTFRATWSHCCVRPVAAIPPCTRLTRVVSWSVSSTTRVSHRHAASRHFGSRWIRCVSLPTRPAVALS